MEQKKPFGEKLEAFFAGKGFYIVLFLCVAVIGVSAWSMLAGIGNDVDSDDMNASLSENYEEEENTEGPDSVVTGSMDEDTFNDAQPTPASQASAEPEPQEETPASTPAEDVQEPQENTASSSPAEEQSTASYFIWPVTGQVEADYAMASLTYNTTMRDWRTHDGVDIAAELGTQVKAAATGTVSQVYDDDMYGTTVIINHGNGLQSIYANLAASPPVSEGQSVSVGQVIGSVGDTALCETSMVTHLHFAMSKDGESVDPTEYMP